ncbi:MAG: DUF1289 domain-containing protein [Methylophilaceae bacterium]
MAKAEVQSPCISICSMNEATGLCVGCFRTMEEIEQWWDLPLAKQSEIIEKARAREIEMFD